MAGPSRKRTSIHLADESDPDLLHVCEELGVPASDLSHNGIDSMTQLLEKKKDLKAQRLGNLKKIWQTVLYDVCLWHDSMVQQKRGPVEWQKAFSEAIFNSFQGGVKKEPIATPSINPKHVFAVASMVLHSGEEEGISQYAESDLEAMYEWVAGETVKALSDNLKHKCNFDVKEYAVLWYRAIFSGEGGHFDVHGHTQSGKSTLKALAFAVCEMVSLPLFVITKGVAESRDLKDKIGRLIDGCAKKISPRFQWWKKDVDMLNVIADTAAQINRVVQRVNRLRARQPNLKFALILDECDAMYRTSGREQKAERAFDELMELRPCLPIFITATPLPTLLTKICRQGRSDVTMLQIGTSEAYSGVKDLRPIQDDNGDDLFLRHGSLSRKEGILYACKPSKLKLENRDRESLFPAGSDFEDMESSDFPSLRGREHIPFTNDGMMRFYDDASFESDTQRGFLLLDCTISAVWAQENIFDKGCSIQNIYRAQGKDIILVIFVGKGIYVRRPGHKQGRFTKARIGIVLQRLDEIYGLDTPIFVFGYTKMRRCISYCSNHRVPTHFVLLLGQGQSNENFIQAIGRATGDLLQKLKENGHDHPKILTNEDDLLMARKYCNYIDQMNYRRSQGDTAMEALMGQIESFTHEQNFLLHSNRKTGQDKTLAALLPDSDAFVDEPSASDHVNKKDHYWDNDIFQKVMQAFSDLYDERGESQVGHPPDSFSVKDLQEMYNDTYQYSHGNLTKSELRKVLTQMNRDVLIQKDGKDRWTVKSMKVLKDMINPLYCK